jgi:hypothetical protein
MLMTRNRASYDLIMIVGLYLALFRFLSIYSSNYCWLRIECIECELWIFIINLLSRKYCFIQSFSSRCLCMLRAITTLKQTLHISIIRHKKKRRKHFFFQQYSRKRELGNRSLYMLASRMRLINSHDIMKYGEYDGVMNVNSTSAASLEFNEYWCMSHN